MIIAWGPLDDPPLARVLDVLDGRGMDLAHLDEPVLAELRYDVSFAGEPTGWMDLDGRRLALSDLRAMYARPGTATTRPAVAAAAMLSTLAAATPAVVVNRPWAGRSNCSKPHQLRVIQRAGLRVPDTVVTTDPGTARAFLERHDRLVYKSVSGIRSIVAAIGAREAERLEMVSTGPVQLQEWVDGTDVRVHVVGGRWFATRVSSPAVDYRYAHLDGATVDMSAIDIPDTLGHRLVDLTQQMGLLVSGVDLRQTPSGEWCCFEVNPSPGFTYYEEHTGQPIAEAIADLLCESG
jgi:glutathione synthase/RimK-type ligase-like ATP-grasp enzyme